VAPASPDTFDETFELAVRKLQINSGLHPNGTLDAPTREALDQRPCDYPDSDRLLDPRDKFDIVNDVPVGHGLMTYNFSGTPTQAQKNLVQNAAGAWNRLQTNVFIQPTPQATGCCDSLCTNKTCGPDVTITFCTVGSAGCQVSCNSCGTQFGNPMQVQYGPNIGLAVAMHELGHTMHLDHSSFSNALMCTNVPNVTAPQEDDTIALNALYPNWQNLQFPETAWDIGAGGGTPAVWATATSGNIYYYKYDANSRQPTWTQVDGAAYSIAVDDGGRPWVVDANGGVWRRNMQGNYWQQLAYPPVGGALDIAAGRNSQNEAYVTGTDNNPGGGTIYSWNEAAFQWQQLPGGGQATQIAVANGQPYVIPTDNSIWRLQGSSWNQFSNGAAVDVGADPDSRYVWVAGTDPQPNGFGLWVWDEQAAANGGRAQAAWKSVPLANQPVANPPGPGPQGITAIAVHAGSGLPYVVNSAGAVFTLSLTALQGG
jgi:hypothetical protein